MKALVMAVPLFGKIVKFPLPGNNAALMDITS
jgi:hypothetical protein